MLRPTKDPNKSSSSRVAKDELSGFLCPDCLIPLSSPDALLRHFESSHGDLKTRNQSAHQLSVIDSIKNAILDVPAGSVITVTDEEHSEEQQKRRYDLLEEMSQHNKTLLLRIASDAKRISELECVLNLLLDGTSLAEAFEFSDESLKARIEKFLEKQVVFATLESEVEDSKLRLHEKEDELSVLRLQLASKSDAELQSRTSVEIQTEDDGSNVVLLQDELARMKAENTLLADELSTLRSQRPSFCPVTVDGLSSGTSTGEIIPVTSNTQSADADELSTRVSLLQQRLHELETLRNDERNSSTAALESVECQLKKLELHSSEFQSKAEQTISDLRSELNKKDHELKGHKETMDSLKKELENLGQKNSSLSDQLIQSSETIQTLKERLSDLDLKIETERNSHAEDLQNMSQKLSTSEAEIERLRAKCQDYSDQIMQQEKRIENTEHKFAECRDTLEQELEAARAKLASSKKETDSLMERLIETEDQVETLKEELSRHVSEVECLNKAIFELGRENQSLQIMREKVTNRQWTKDDDAPACASCNKEFSLGNRRHHCRNCGGVFCHSCSSNRASTAASKDPVRVCDPCYSELTR